MQAKKINEITSQKMFDNTLNYIHQDPVITGFVFNPEDWNYSSAIDFCGPDGYPKKGLVELSYS